MRNFAPQIGLRPMADGPERLNAEWESRRDRQIKKQIFNSEK